MLYWTNWHDDHPTIERSFMNGSERQVLIREELHKPSGITLDLTERKIYWADNLRYGAFRIERSNLDGSRREIVYSGVNQFLFGLTVMTIHEIISTQSSTKSGITRLNHAYLSRLTNIIFTGQTGRTGGCIRLPKE